MDTALNRPRCGGMIVRGLLTVCGAAAATVAIGVTALPAYAAELEPEGAPRPVEWTNGARAYAVDPERGLTLKAHGPQNVLLELRSKQRGKRVIIDLVRDGKFRSRNPVRLSDIADHREYRFVTLLGVRVPKGEHRYTISVQGLEMIAIPRVVSRALTRFAVRPEEDITQPLAESVAISQAQRDGSPGTSGAQGLPSGDESQAGAASGSGGGGDSAGDSSLAFGEPFGGDASSDDGSSSLISFSEGVGQQVSSEDAKVRLALTEDTLAIGGMTYLRALGSAPRDEPATLHSPGIVDVYMDARPADSVRAFVRARAAYDTANQTAGVRLALDQLWLKADIYKTVYVTAGKQPLKWGSGRFWNPTDFLNREHRDPLAAFDERKGVTIIKAHAPITALGWNAYALLDLDGAASLSDAGAAFRLEAVFGQSELSASTLVRRHRRPMYGLDVSAGIGPFDLRAEASGQQGGPHAFWRGDFAPESGVFPVRYEKSRWFVQYVLNCELTFEYYDDDAVTLGVEYFGNDGGYKREELYPWLMVNGEFRPLYMGAWYAGGYIALPSPLSWNDTKITVTALTNGSDGSWLARADLRSSVLSFIALDIFATWHLGDRGELNLDVNVPATDYPGLETGLRVRSPMLEFGVGMQVNM